MNHADDELLAGAAFTVYEYCRIDRRHASSQFEDVLHGLAARDEILRRGMASDAFAQQIELAFPFLQESLAFGDFMELRLHSLAQAFHFRPELRSLEVELQALQRIAPTLGITPLDDAVFVSLSRA